MQSHNMDIFPINFNEREVPEILPLYTVKHV